MSARTIPTPPKIGADALPRPCSARARVSCAASKRQKLARLVQAARRVTLRAEWRAFTQAVQAHSEDKDSSLTKIAVRAGLSRRTLSRLIRGQVNLEAWLPKLREAACKIAP